MSVNTQSDKFLTVLELFSNKSIKEIDVHSLNTTESVINLLINLTDLELSTSAEDISEFNYLNCYSFTSDNSKESQNNVIQIFESV